MSSNDDWFAKYKNLERKVLEKNKKIKELEEKEKKVEREFAFENLINEIDSRSKNRGLNTKKKEK